MYIIYEEYLAMGGKASAEAFPALEVRARKKLDYWTQGRITEPDADVQLCMTMLIDQLAAEASDELTVSSVSQDGVSLSLVDAKSADERMRDVYDRVVEILPVGLVSLCV